MKCTHRSALFATTALGLGFGVVLPAMAANDSEEIIVTARRVEERLQDVPISITVFNQKQLTDRNIVSASDLAAYTPNLSTNSRYSSETTTFAIRGFAQELRTTASVGTYFADVVAPRAGQSVVPAGDGAGPGYFFDLSNVQVLKGPQGTLFGRNTTGGAVVIVPQKPTGEFGGYIEGSYGNYDMRRLQGVLNVPLSSKARLRVGFDRMTRDGYLNNVSGIGPSRLGNTDYIAGRASLVVDVTPDIENYTIALITNSDNNAPEFQLFAVNPIIPSATPPFFQANPLAGAFRAQLARQGKDPYAVSNDTPNPVSWLQQWQLINTTAWHATDLLTVKNIASYSVVRQSVSQDIFGTDIELAPGLPPLQINTIHPAPNLHSADQYNITEELQLQGRSANNKLIWQFGAYYEQSTPRAPAGAATPNNAACFDVNTFNCIAFDPTTAAVTTATAAVRFRNLGIYGQGTYAILDNLKLTAGLRFTHDETSGTGSSTIYPFLAPFSPPSLTTPLCVEGTPPACSLHQRVTSDAPTWLLDLEYSPVTDVMAYVKYARGYRQGAVNPFGSPGFQTFQPETVEVYEVGAKTSFHGKIPGTFNAALFYNDFSQQQLSVALLSTVAPVAPGGAIVNAGSSKMYGAEIDSTLRPFESFRLDMAAAYLYTKLEDERSISGVGIYNVVIPTSSIGGDLPYAPKYKASITGTYTFPLPDTVGTLELGATYTYQSSYVTATESASPFFKADATNLVNLNLNWFKIGGGPVDASLFVTNVLDERYTAAVEGVYNFYGFESRQLGLPRMFGARVRLRFGADAK